MFILRFRGENVQKEVRQLLETMKCKDENCIHSICNNEYRIETKFEDLKDRLLNEVQERAEKVDILKYGNEYYIFLFSPIYK